MKKLILLIAPAILCAAAPAQVVGTGAYNFATFDNRGFDSINVGNLNVRFSIPLVSKPGRGLPFNYTLNYEGLIWTPVTSGGVTTWVPDPSWGFLGEVNGTSFSGYLTYMLNPVMCNVGGGHTTTVNGTSNYVYHDPFGVDHTFNFQQTVNCGNGSGQGISVVASGDGTAYDTSGYKLVGTNAVQSKTGAVITPAKSATGADPTGLNDTNGNQISKSTSGVFTDTTGKTALTIAGSNPVTFTYPLVNQSNGTTSASASLTYKAYTVRSNFGCTSIGEYGSHSINLVDHVTLADGTAYLFTYEGTPGAADGAVTGRLASITLPTGGLISYSYYGGGQGVNGIACADGVGAGLNRTTADGVRQYQRAGVSGNTKAFTTLITDEANNQTLYHFSVDFLGLYEATHQQAYQGATSGTLLEEVFTCYNGLSGNCDGQSITSRITEADTTTSFNGGNQQVVKNTYDTSGNLGTSRVFDGSTLLQITNTAYNANSEMTSNQVTNGSSAVVSLVTYGYDEGTLTSTSGLPQHGGTPSGTRGNQTSVHVSIDGTTTNTLNTVTSYYDTGMALSVAAPGNFMTTYGYDSTGTFVQTTTLPTPSSGVSLSTSATYDAASGALLSSTGMNGGQTTSVTNYDARLRPTLLTLPNTGQISYNYPSSTQVNYYQNLDKSTGRNGAGIVISDPYGRTIRTAIFNGQAGSNNYYLTDTCYNSVGLVKFVSVRYAGPGSGAAEQCSGAGTAYIYDALGRVMNKTTSDGTATTQYNNRSVLAKDVNGVQVIRTYDALGRLTQTCERTATALAGQSLNTCTADFSSPSGYITSYDYTVADQVTVNQGTQKRVFTTDTAGRTTSTLEPERGQVSTSPPASTLFGYAYNGTGLVLTRTRLRANQGGATQTVTTTQNDALGRPVSTTYNDGLTPNKTFSYDKLPNGSIWSNTPTYTKGLLVTTSSGSGNTNAQSEFSYDIMGVVINLWQCAPSICQSSPSSRPLSMSYDLGNQLTNESDQASGSISYTRSAAGEITAINNLTNYGTGNPTNLVTSVVNTQFGPSSYSLGNGVSGVNTFDSMGRPSGTYACGIHRSRMRWWNPAIRKHRSLFGTASE